MKPEIQIDDDKKSKLRFVGIWTLLEKILRRKCEQKRQTIMLHMQYRCSFINDYCAFLPPL